MSAEKNPRLRSMAKALKRCNAMLVAGESLQVVLIECYYSGAFDTLTELQKPKRKGARK